MIFCTGVTELLDAVFMHVRTRNLDEHSRVLLLQAPKLVVDTLKCVRFEDATGSRRLAALGALLTARTAKRRLIEGGLRLVCKRREETLHDERDREWGTAEDGAAPRFCSAAAASCGTVSKALRHPQESSATATAALAASRSSHDDNPRPPFAFGGYEPLKPHRIERRYDIGCYK